MGRHSLEHIRFGYGLTPDEPVHMGAPELLNGLKEPDELALIYPREPSNDRLQTMSVYHSHRRKDRRSEITVSMLKRLRRLSSKDFAVRLTRSVAAKAGFRERLVAFWSDHFTVAAQTLNVSVLIGPFHDEAIRPNLTGPFSQLLFAAATHPAMLHYLDQQNSVGPNSVLAKEGRGLNENLAREILELHSLGVGASYGQNDVTEFAKLLTGLRVTPNGMRYVPAFAEPGAKRVLGKTYGGNVGAIEILSAFEDIALKPETADHLARKLVIHFIEDVPEEALVTRMAAAYLASGGKLMSLYEVMLADPTAWSPDLRKVKQPYDFMVSAARAIGVTADQIMDMGRGAFRSAVATPLARMGQPPFEPMGPDGWPEEAEAWITPAMLAGRIDWASGMAERLAGKVDPRTLLDRVLPGLASDDLRFAVNATESGWEGVALILASPEFNRR